MNDKHYAEIAPAKGTITITDRETGKQLAKTGHALKLSEYYHGRAVPMVFYIPRNDVALSLLEENDGHATHCPIKGEASYFSLKGGAKNIAWTYEDPIAHSRLVKGFVAFDRKLTKLVHSA